MNSPRFKYTKPTAIVKEVQENYHTYLKLWSTGCKVYFRTCFHTHDINIQGELITDSFKEGNSYKAVCAPFCVVWVHAKERAYVRLKYCRYNSYSEIDLNARINANYDGWSWAENRRLILLLFNRCDKNMFCPLLVFSSYIQAIA